MVADPVRLAGLKNNCFHFWAEGIRGGTGITIRPKEIYIFLCTLTFQGHG